jgi:hypothetical protein
MEPAAFAALILTAFDTGLAGDVRNEAGAVLRHFLTEQARRVARGDQALVEELVSHVCVQCGRGMYVPRQDTTPEAWVLTVMRNYRADANVLRLRTRPGETILPAIPDPRDDRPARELHLDLESRFCPEDDDRVARWSASQRVILLPWWLLWRKADETRWRQTVLAAGLPHPFPGSEFARLHAADRTRYLADSLGVTTNAVTRALVRGRGRVMALRFVRELGGRG